MENETKPQKDDGNIVNQGGFDLKKKQIFMMVSMGIAIAILGVFVYIETKNQAAIIELMKRCDIQEICSKCYSPLRNLTVH